MVIRFSKIHIHNFYSYIDTEISLENKGFCLVSGQNKFKKDNALSNGSGKSTIWSAICYALTGETIAGIKTNLKNVNASDSECYVTLNFSADADDYEIKRWFSPKSDLKIIKNKLDISGKGIRESEKIFGENLPDLTKDLISSTIILGQGMPNKFSSFSPSGRKDLLEKLTKSDFMIDDIKTRISSRQEELSKQLRSIEDGILINTTKLTSIQTELKSAKKDKENYVELDYDEFIDAESKALKILTESKESILKTCGELSFEADSLNNKILALTTEKTNLNAEEFKCYTEAYNSTIADKKSAQNSINYLELEVKRLKNVRDICPTCGQKIPGVLKPDTSDKEAEILKLQNNISQIDARLLEISNKHNSYVCTINEQYKIIDSLQEQLKENKNKYSTEDSKLASISDQILKETEKYNKLVYDKENSKKIYDALVKKIESLLLEESSLNSLIETSKLAKCDIDSHIAVLKKIESLVKRDFRGYLLYNIIEYLSSKAKEYSKVVFDTDELNIYLDGNALDISYCGKLYESLSGGEKQRVDVITQFAIRDLLQTYFNYSSNILVLDEITDNLDKLASEKIFDLITNKLKDVESIFIVSHHDDELAIPVDTEIHVIKDENSISSVSEIQ